jgi:hypothetical protein
MLRPAVLFKMAQLVLLDSGVFEGLKRRNSLNDVKETRAC